MNRRVVLLLLALDLACICGVPKFPTDINLWSASAAERLGLRRAWDREDLQAGASILNSDQFQTLFSKLRSGKAITVVAFGDSITKDLSGELRARGCRT